MRILSVDDDPVFLEIMQNTLRDLGFDEITSAASADAALQVVTGGSFAPDCFLVDIQMPRKNGIELVRELRAIECYRETPIVMVTSMSDKGHIDEAFAAGATDYVTKPLDQIEFRARIGMVQRLHDERERNVALLGQAAQSGQLAAVDFAAPIQIPELENCVDFLALENYLLTLGRSRMTGFAALSFTITNAEFHHQVSDPEMFVEMLADVAQSIFHNLKTHEFLISYVGSGTFVVLLTNGDMVDTQDLQVGINDTLREFEEAYAMDRLPVPRVRAGQVVRHGVFSKGGAASILHRAIASVAPTASQGTVIGRLVA